MAEEKKLYLRVKGVEHGPFTVEEVKTWIEGGKFKPTDYIRMEGMKHWVMAKNLVHLKEYFDAKKEEDRKGAFASWLGQVREGKPPIVLTPTGVTEEHTRIAEARKQLEEDAKRLEEREAELREQIERELTKKQEEEFERLRKERERLEEHRMELEEAEIEIKQMERTVRRRRRIPLIIAGVVIVAVIAVSTPIVINYYKSTKELQEAINRIDIIDNEIKNLMAKLEDAETTMEREAIMEKIEELKKEREELVKEVEKKGGGEPIENIETTLGSVSITGPLSIIGPGSDDPSRSSSTVDSIIRGRMGAINSVYNRELRSNPSLEGKVVVSFTVSSDGTVTRANVISSTLSNSKLENAIVSNIMLARFPSTSSGDITVTYPFTFETK